MMDHLTSYCSVLVFEQTSRSNLPNQLCFTSDSKEIFESMDEAEWKDIFQKPR